MAKLLKPGREIIAEDLNHLFNLIWEKGGSGGFVTLLKKETLSDCNNIVHGYSCIVFDDFFSYIPNQFNTRGNSLRLTTPLDKTNIRKYFFLVKNN